MPLNRPSDFLLNLASDLVSGVVGEFDIDTMGEYDFYRAKAKAKAEALRLLRAYGVTGPTPEGAPHA